MANNLTLRAALTSALVPKAAPVATSPSGYGGWWPLIREPFMGAWQRNMEERPETLLTYHAVYSCITLIASDIAKCRLKLMQQDSDGIWSEIVVAAFSPVLRKPNHYQNRIQFFESWLTSKLTHGNTYVLKARDNRQIVTELYVLDPLRTKAVVAPNGDVYYQLSTDYLADIAEATVVPASEIIHDLTTLRYHPLCGIPPMAPAALAATHGLKIQRNSIRLFENAARPSGFLTAPGTIDQVTADRLKSEWQQNYGGDNIGKVAVLGDALKFESMAQNAVDAQLIEQLGLSGKMVCSSFNVPAYMVGVGDPPAYDNIEALNQQYYSQCLQKHIEAIELCLDEGLGLTEIQGKTYGTEFDLDDLLRMDTATRIKVYTDAVKGGLFKPNEGRAKFDLGRVPGGDQVYLQQQNFSLEALAKRDAKDDPFANANPPKPSPASGGSSDGAAAADGTTDPNAQDVAAQAQLAAWELKRQLDLLAA
jgi:HK97 family phage portal protein